jgi:predicted nucleic acid-binding protein
VARLIILDSGPLGILTVSPTHQTAAPCHAWLAALEAVGAIIVIPAVADYEVRRGLIFKTAPAKLRNLNALVARFGRLPVSQVAWDLAADLWAQANLSGQPTAGPKSLDADAVIAGQALTVGQPGDTVTMATINVRHMARFPGLDARDWPTIT